MYLVHIVVVFVLEPVQCVFSLLGGIEHGYVLGKVLCLLKGAEAPSYHF